MKENKNLILARRIWYYLNGRYESFDKETKRVSKMIEKIYPIKKI